MFYGICNLSIVAVRFEASEKSEMVTQLLFGEHFTILEKHKNWCKIKIFSDGYEGFLDNKQFEEITEDYFTKLSTSEPIYSGEIIDFISDSNNDFTTIPIGSRLPFFFKNEFTINTKRYIYDGKVYSEKLGISDASTWNFLTGDQEKIFEMGQTSYLTTAMADQMEPGGFLHSGAFLLIDQQGRIRGVYDGTKSDQVDRLINDIPKILTP